MKNVIGVILGIPILIALLYFIVMAYYHRIKRVINMYSTIWLNIRRKKSKYKLKEMMENDLTLKRRLNKLEKEFSKTRKTKNAIMRYEELRKTIILNRYNELYGYVPNTLVESI